MAKKSDITGAIGVAPPPDAPIETAQPLTPEFLAEQRARAAENERTLPPFNPKGTGRPVPAAAAAPPAQPQPPAVQIVDPLANDFFDPLPSSDEGMAAEATHDEPLPPLTADERARMPAASNTDTPAKGLLPNLTPPEQPDKFEGISRGGFTDVGDAQYFPLTGDELHELCLALCDTLVAQIKNDLRFSIALTYPRVRARLRLEVEGAVDDRDGGFVIEKVHIPKSGAGGSTPLDVARQRATEVVFVVQAGRQEFSEDGDVDTPPDQIREELGLARPRKQIIQTQGGGQAMVDIISPGSDLRAVNR
jgi:hypothetical protein